MNSTTIIGYSFDGEVFCTDCTEYEYQRYPIFCGAEFDYTPTCAICGRNLEGFTLLPQLSEEVEVEEVEEDDEIEDFFGEDERATFKVARGTLATFYRILKVEEKFFPQYKREPFGEWVPCAFARQGKRTWDAAYDMLEWHVGAAALAVKFVGTF